MKKTILLLFALIMSVSINAQKNELKSAEKELKKENYTSAKSSIDQAEALISGTDDKTKAKFYYLKASIYAGLGKTSAANYNVAADAYNDLFAIEKEMGTTKYSKLAEPGLNAIISDVSAKGIKSYQDKNYTAAKDELHLVYDLSKKDTVFLEYAANAAYLDKDFDAAIDYYTELKNLGYTGITVEYSAKNKTTGEREVFSSKENMELMKKSNTYTDFEEKVSESKKASIIKNIALLNVDKGDTDAAFAAIAEARAADPKDVSLILTEANLHIKLGDKEKFGNLMEEAIKLDPNNHVLYYNLGVISAEQGEIEKAKEYYNKAIELKPDYADAYVNLGSALLYEDKALVEEMNQNLSNFDKYDQIKAKQVELYKSVIPVYEKAYELRPNDIDTIRTLMSLYENTEMETKFKEMKAAYDALQ